MDQHVTKPIRSFQVAGFILLFIASYIDNVRGPLLTIIAKDLSINYEIASRLLSIGNISACAALLLMIPMMKTMSEGNSSKLAALVVIIGGVISYYVTSQPTLYIFAIFIGIGTAMFGVLSNIFVMRGTPLLQHANMLSGLQVMYGLSSMLAPAAAAFVTSQSLDWRFLFIGLIPIASIFLIFMQFGVEKHEPAPQKQDGTFHLTGTQVLLLITFCFYVIAEVSCSMWMTPYLVETFKFDISSASLYASGFFFFMMISRLYCFFFLRDSNREKILMASLFFPLLALAIGIGAQIPLILPLAGLFGPFWPIFVSKVTKNYPKEWRSLTLWLVFGLQGSLLFMNYTMGRLSSLMPMKQAYLISPIFQVLTITCFFILRKKSKSF